MNDGCAFGLEVAAAGDHDHLLLPGNALPSVVPGAASDDEVVPHGGRLEVPEVPRQVPRQAAIAADHPVFGDGDDQGNHHRHTAIGALMRG